MISLELLTEQTLDFVRELRNKNKEYFVYSETISEDEHRAWFKKISQDMDYKFLVIKDDAQNIGTISLKRNEHIIEIGNVLIEESHRGKGVLKEILENLEKAFPELTLKLEVLYSNTNAINVYTKLGFKPNKKQTITLWK